MEVLITNNVPDEHLAPLQGIAEIIKSPKQAYALSTREEVLSLAPELDGIINQHEPKLHTGLLAHPHVVFSPHVGGGTLESRKQARLICAENVAAALRGQRHRMR